MKESQIRKLAKKELESEVKRLRGINRILSDALKAMLKAFNTPRFADLDLPGMDNAIAKAISAIHRAKGG